MRFIFLLTMAVLLAYPAKGQTCTCESNFEWVKKTIEENDAGFRHIIDRKGQAAYELHNQLVLEKIKAAKTLTECSKILNGWLNFFRSGHIGIRLLANDSKASGVVDTWSVDIFQFKEIASTE